MDLDHSSDQKCSCEGERAELELSRGRLPLDWFLAFPHRIITAQSQKVQEPVSARQNRSEPWKERKERWRNGTFQPRVFLPAAHVSKRAVAGIFMDHPTSPSAGPPMPIALNALAIYRLGATTTRGGLRVQTPGGVKKPASLADKPGQFWDAKFNTSTFSCRRSAHTPLQVPDQGRTRSICFGSKQFVLLFPPLLRV